MFQAIAYFCIAYIAISVYHYLSMRWKGYSKSYSLDYICRKYYGY